MQVSYSCGKFSIGDIVEIFKGADAPIGKIVKVEKITPVHNQYGILLRYDVLLSGGIITNADNCMAIDFDQLMLGKFSRYHSVVVVLYSYTENQEGVTNEIQV